MQNIVTKRVYEPAAEADGLRVLVDRLWPRGLRKEAATLDAWNKDIAPSTELRKWFDHKADRFDTFALRYEAELATNPAVGDLLKTAGKGRLTLLYAAHDPVINHATVLAKFLNRSRSTH
jgi:uncharacterized protein YeaO (DUF488 family)